MKAMNAREKKERQQEERAVSHHQHVLLGQEASKQARRRTQDPQNGRLTISGGQCASYTPPTTEC